MSFKSKVLAAAATLIMVGGVGAAGALTAGSAAAATPSCGPSCVDLFAQQFGSHKTPGYVLDVLKQGEKVGQPIILFRSANYDPAEDFAASYQGKVSDFYGAGLVSASLDLHYGAGIGLTGVPAAGNGFPDDWAFEIQYAPYGVDSSLCVGLASTATSGEGVTLQPCGTSSTTVWVIDQADSSTGHMTPILKEYVPLINGSDTNFSQPFVLTYPSAGFPTDTPRPELTVRNVGGFSNPSTHDPAGVDGDQMWGADTGTLG